MPITDRDRRTLIIGGSVVGFFILAFLVYKLFLSGGAEPIAAPPSPTSVVPPSPTLSPSPSPSSGGGGVVTFGGRDAFCIPQSYVSRLLLLHLPLPADAYYCPGVIVPTATASGTSTATSTSTTTPTSSTSVPSAPVASSTTVGGRAVALLGVAPSASGTRAHVEVDGKVYYVAVGTRFAGGSFELQGAAGSCASFLYGDQAFSLCRA